MRFSLFRPLAIALAIALTTAAPIQASEAKESKKNSWSRSEYSGKRNDKTLRTAMLSKGFAWLSGSPTDNEILSIGKSSQFFGFVALRYESGRSAKRGNIGQSFHQLATAEQRSIVLDAVKSKSDVQHEWWQVRSEIMDHLESTLYTGAALNESELKKLGAKLGLLNARAALYEAQAIAKVEDLLTKEQWATLKEMRRDPDIANQKVKNNDFIDEWKPLSKNHKAHYEDLFAKGFSWLTGTFKQRKIIPKGQPAQFFGFVAVRHKSGHGASRGKIAKRFDKILSSKQRHYIDQGVASLKPWVDKYLSTRNKMLKQTELLRTNYDNFDQKSYDELAKELGVLEVICASIEATQYEKIERSLSITQRDEIKLLRSDYILEENTELKTTKLERGQKIMNLCASCHEKGNGLAPRFGKLIGTRIAAENYAYSSAFKAFAAKENTWSRALLDEFLQSPEKLIPGNIMTFKGLSKAEDRSAIIDFIESN